MEADGTIDMVRIHLTSAAAGTASPAAAAANGAQLPPGTTTGEATDLGSVPRDTSTATGEPDENS
jgi:hypothetical protein